MGSPRDTNNEIQKNRGVGEGGEEVLRAITGHIVLFSLSSHTSAVLWLNSFVKASSVIDHVPVFGGSSGTVFREIVKFIVNTKITTCNF